MYELEPFDTTLVTVKSNPFGYDKVKLKNYITPSQMPLDIGFSLDELNALGAEEDQVTYFLRTDHKSAEQKERELKE